MGEHSCRLHPLTLRVYEQYGIIKIIKWNDNTNEPPIFKKGEESDQVNPKTRKESNNIMRRFEKAQRLQDLHKEAFYLKHANQYRLQILEAEANALEKSTQPGTIIMMLC